MATTKKSNEIPFGDISRQVDVATAAADEHRADRIEHLLVARKAKEAGLTREQARLTRKLGADHPRVAAIADRRTANAGLRRDLVLESARAKTDIPKVGQETWALLGMVREADQRPVTGAAIALYDAGGRWIENLGYGCTDAQGKFRIEARNVPALDQPVYVRVTSADGALLAVDPTPLTPTGGALDYREITVSSGSRPCEPPSTSTPTRQPDPALAADAWVVRGRVTDKDGNGLGGLNVSLFDKDGIFDDRLGQTQTDEQGDYMLAYPEADFRDLIERKADIYIKVVDSSGETLYSSKDAVRYEAGRVDTINAQVKRRKKQVKRRKK